MPEFVRLICSWQMHPSVGMVKINQCKKEINFIMKMVMVIVLKCKANGSWRQSKKLKKWAKKDIERREFYQVEIKMIVIKKEKNLTPI